MIHSINCLDYMKTLSDFSLDIIYCDPPYALGSDVIVRADGKPDYSKATDFMAKWIQPTGEFWEQWFLEAMRILKHGGRIIMFGMDRQVMLNKYYACAAGFQEQQSLYWYFISSFPKSSDMSINIDKNAGASREIIGEKELWGHNAGSGAGSFAKNEFEGLTGEKRTEAITAPSTELAKKYDGFRYSVAPLKQTCENILVFQKPYKTGSCLHDTLAYENGDATCTCGALNIADNKIPGVTHDSQPTEHNSDGRYPAQTFLTGTDDILDRQSGIIKPSGDVKGTEPSSVTNGIYGDYNGRTQYPAEQYIGGCSKILHKCEYEEGGYDLYFYEPKVAKSEREEGLRKFEMKLMARSGGAQKAEQAGEDEYLQDNIGLNRISKVKNNHPTLKPFSLNERILKLFKTPNPQKILYPFAGAGSEIIGGLRAGFTDWDACEINEDYILIANARIAHELEKGKQLNIFDL